MTDDGDAKLLSFSPLATVLNHDDYNTPTQHWYSDAIGGLLCVGRGIVQDQMTSGARSSYHPQQQGKRSEDHPHWCWYIADQSAVM